MQTYWGWRVKSIIVSLLFFSFLSSLVVCWHPRVASCLNRRDGGNLQEVFGMVVGAFCVWDSGEWKFCRGLWGINNVHRPVENKNCTWDGGKCKQLCMGWWGMKTVHRTVKNKNCLCVDGNEICAGDGGEWKLYIKWWWIISVLGIVTGACCAGCILPWFLNFLVIVQFWRYLVATTRYNKKGLLMEPKELEE